MVKLNKKLTSKMPMGTGMNSERCTARQSTHSAITVSSNDSEVDDYETPGTSAMATPAAELAIGSSNGKGKNRTSKAPPTLSSVDTEFGNIPCQSQAEAQLLSDQILAQRLQEEEYDEDDAPLYKKRRFVKDSDLEESALSEPLSDEDYENDSERDLGKKGSKRGTRIAKATGSRIRPTLPIASAPETESELNDSAIEPESDDDPLGNGNRTVEDRARNRHSIFLRRRSAHQVRRVFITASLRQTSKLTYNFSVTSAGLPI